MKKYSVKELLDTIQISAANCFIRGEKIKCRDENMSKQYIEEGNKLMDAFDTITEFIGCSKDGEEITKDQREEEKVKVCPPHEYESLGTEDGEKECVYCSNTPLDSFKQEQKKVDHQALREESLKEVHWLEMYEEPSILNVETNKSERMLHVGFEVQMKYADAWRALLDNQKEE